MSPPRVETTEYEFYFADLDNSVLVQSGEDGVVIRAARNNFSEHRKAAFIRRLAAEGYIPDSFQWSMDTVDGRRGIKWVIDRSWLRLDPRWTRRSAQFIKRLFLSAAVLWLFLLGWLFFFHR